MSNQLEAETEKLVPMSLGEMFGPVPCEREDCRKAAWMVWMKQEEYDRAKSQEDTHPISYVFGNKIGKALCDECAIKPVGEFNYSSAKQDNAQWVSGYVGGRNVGVASKSVLRMECGNCQHWKDKIGPIGRCELDQRAWAQEESCDKWQLEKE